MKCFNHQTEDAVGICKACNKAVCNQCAIDTGYGLACCTECASEAADQDAIIKKNKLLLGIGANKKVLPTGLIMFFFFGVVFTGFGLYLNLIKGRTDFFTIIMGLGFLAIGGLGWYRNRKINLSC